jgi:large subunit ribosomal protein L29|tara:strand:- start:251 stop:466 length:216 start_codon:yes stop_codon:yes gene_type:complete
VKSKEFNIKLNGLSAEELNEILLNTQLELRKLKMNHKTAELENPLEIRSVRRNLSRINTEIKKRELQQSTN